MSEINNNLLHANDPADAGSPTPPRSEAPPLTNAELESLNQGIRHTVKTLREWGFNTCDSGDGQTAQFDCDLKCPYVHIMVSPCNLVDETNRLISALVNAGVVFSPPPNPQYDQEAFDRHPNIEASYLPLQSCAAIHLFNVIIPQNY